MSFLTFSEAFDQWEQDIKPLVIERYGKDDEPALSESWNDYTDMLCKDGQFTGLHYKYCPAWDDKMPNDDVEFILEKLNISGFEDDLRDLFDNY